MIVATNAFLRVELQRRSPHWNVTLQNVSTVSLHINHRIKYSYVLAPQECLTFQFRLRPKTDFFPVVFWVSDIGPRGFPVYESGRQVLVRRDDDCGVVLRVCPPGRPLENTPFIAPVPAPAPAPSPVAEEVVAPAPAPATEERPWYHRLAQQLYLHQPAAARLLQEQGIGPAEVADLLLFVSRM